MTSLPNCFNIIPQIQFTNWINQIEAAGKREGQEAIQELVDEIYAQINLLEANIESQIAALNPLLALIIDPADLPALISWVKNFITSFLTPYLVPLTTYEAQIAEIATQVVAIAAAIEQIQNERPEIHITIPQFPNISCKL